MHEKSEGAVGVIRGQAEFALGFCLDVVTVGVGLHAILILEQKPAAPWVQYIIGADGIFDDRHHRSLAWRCRPEKVPLGRVQTMEMARPAGVKILLVIMKVKAVEVGALVPAGLGNPQHLATPQWQSLAGAGLDRDLLNHLSLG